jgi:DNA-binding CsgD family transcriptional regulator
VLSHPVFNRLGEKLILLASDATLIDLTSSARTMLDRRLTLRLEHGRLACMAARGTVRLQALVVKVACNGDTGPAATLALPGGDDLPPALATLRAMACWWPERDAGRATVVLMHILESDTRVPIPLDALRTLFGLTLAEARVARSALDACGLSAVAEQLGIRLTTARTHLQHVFEKTGTKR